MTPIEDASDAENVGAGDAFHAGPEVNVGGFERGASLTMGVALLALALSQRRARGAFTFEDGVTATATATTPCRGTGAAARGARPAMRVRVTQSRVPAGRRSHFAVRVSSPDPRCRRGAAIWIGGRRPHTDARGRASASLAFRAPGRHAVIARKAGCRTATAPIVVRRA